MRKHVVKAALLGFLLLTANKTDADSIFLRGGEKLIGNVLSEDTAKVVFESQTLGRFDIARDRIERIERDAPAPTPRPASTNQAANSAASRLVLTNPFLPWAAGPTEPHAFDWIQLKSGEWLKGKIKSLQDEKLEFDSEELNLFSFDWKDIRTVRSPRLLSVRVENLKPMDGSVLVTTNQVQIMTATATNVYPRAELLAITPTGNRELDKWTGSVSLGITYRAGNTREVDANAHAALQRRTPDTRLSLDYLGNYGKFDGIEIEQNHRFSTQFDYFLSRRLYVRVPELEYLRDPFQNLDHRLTVGAGVGYDLIKTPRTEWNVTTSPSWQRAWFHDVPPGEDTSSDSVALVLATKFDIELTQRLDLIFEYKGQLTRKENGNNNHHAIATLEFEIHKRLKLDLSFEWDRIADPRMESGGKEPTPDDFRLITALGIDF